MRSSWLNWHRLDETTVEKQSLIKQILHSAGLGAGLAVAMMASAQAQSWSLYDGYTSLPTIPFVNGPMSPTKTAKVDLEVGGAKKPIPFVMDTGSTGIVVSKKYFKREPGDVYIGKGKQVYTSSGRVEHGKFYLTNVVIYQNSTTPLATARVTVMDVTKVTCLRHHPKCRPNSNPDVAYMGVGFDRGKASTQPPAPNNNTNPFVNIVSLASGQPVSTLAPGYMITNSGVTLGLSSSVTNNFAFVKLLPNTTNNPPEPAPAWLGAPLTILAGGKQSSGAILPDSGLGYAFLTPPPGASLTEQKCGKTYCLKPGNTIQVYLPGQTAPQPAFYTFTTGASGNPLEPTTVKVNSASTTAFLNTGREFYAGFDYLYDPINGYVGYRWSGTVNSAFGEVTPSVALIGNVNLPAGFTNSLPTVLYGTTTLLPAGTGTFSNTISGSFGLTINGGQVGFTAANTYTGGTSVIAGTLVAGNNAAFGPGPVSLAAGTTLSFMSGSNFTLPNNFQISGDPNFAPPPGTTQTLSGVIADGATPGILNVLGPGTLVLSGISTYSGDTTVSAGTLDVTGSIAKSRLTTVESGATLTGTGTVGSTQINSGGILSPGAAPGTSLTIAGNLAFSSGAIYVVQITPSNATGAIVYGTTTLSGATVDARFSPGSYVISQYDILHATNLDGTTFAGLKVANVPGGFTASLSYSASDVFLNLTAAPSLSGLTINERNVATALENYFNGGGRLPANFLPIFGLTGGAFANTLMQLDGEVATGSEVTAFQLMDEFLNLMLDPFVDGRLGPGFGPGSGFTGDPALGFAPDAQTVLPPEVALAYAGVLKAPPAPAFQQRWTTWGASYGGASTTVGDPAVGSNSLGAQTFGFAAGMDYHYSPDTIVGFALGGGGTNWGLAGGMGTGRSDAFQTGVYGTTRWGPAYLGAALSFANHWMTTNRGTMADTLTANFDAQSYGARVEAGYRYAVLPTLGVSPYAAVQAQAFHTPSYSEADATGGGFGLSYAAMNATDTRTELGSRFDDPAVIGGIPILLRGRLAWAHDFVSNPALSAAFESLPGSSFVVNGAPIPHDSALTSAGAEFFFTPRWTLLVNFDGEFAPTSQTYAGSGTLRYTW
jgi:autotransporter-associated beta strand protein